MIRDLINCPACEKRRQAMVAWLGTLKGKNVVTENKYKRTSLSKLIKASGVSESAVIRVLDVLATWEEKDVTTLVSPTTPTKVSKPKDSDVSADGGTSTES